MVPVLFSLHPSFIFRFHLSPSLVFSTWISFYNFPGCLVILNLLLSNIFYSLPTLPSHTFFSWIHRKFIFSGSNRPFLSSYTSFPLSSQAHSAGFFFCLFPSFLTFVSFVTDQRCINILLQGLLHLQTLLHTI